MLTPASPVRCPLCALSIRATDLPDHLRTLHQVAQGEATVADVPVGRWDWLHPTAPLEHEEELAAACAV